MTDFLDDFEEDDFEGMEYDDPSSDDVTNDQLWDADPDCSHEIIADFGGVHCKHCAGWYCY